MYYLTANPSEANRLEFINAQRTGTAEENGRLYDQQVKFSLEARAAGPKLPEEYKTAKNTDIPSNTAMTTDGNIVPLNRDTFLNNLLMKLFS
jgi:hypothetical protein